MSHQFDNLSTAHGSTITSYPMTYELYANVFLSLSSNQYSIISTYQEFTLERERAAARREERPRVQSSHWVWPLNFEFLKRGKWYPCFWVVLAERCLVPCDHEGRPHTCLLGPMNRVPTIIFTSLLPDPWAQLWPGKWGGHEGGRPWLSFSPDVLITEVYRRICMGSTQITERLWIWRSVWCLGTNPHGYALTYKALKHRKENDRNERRDT